jgi:HAD superfamily hydrolase (TIGR01549 family)
VVSGTNADLVVFDVDGTLYRQDMMRARMAVELLFSCVAHPRTMREARVIRVYRRRREALAGQAGSVDRALEQTAEACGCSIGTVQAIEADWLLRRPLKHLGELASSGASGLMESLRQQGVTLAAWSDYPATEKLSRLGLSFDFTVSSCDADVRSLKPNPSGLDKVMRLAGATPERTLVVGDRDDHDGAAARAQGTDFILVPKGLTRGAGAAIHARVLGVDP